MQHSSPTSPGTDSAFASNSDIFLLGGLLVLHYGADSVDHSISRFRPEAAVLRHSEFRYYYSAIDFFPRVPKFYGIVKQSFIVLVPE